LALLKYGTEDVLRGKMVEVGWHEAVVKEIVESAAATDGSTNWKLTVVIREGGKFDGVPLDRYFNEKAPGFALNYFKAHGANIDEKNGGDLDFQKTIGRPIGIFVEIEEYQKRPKNVIKDFRPPKNKA